MSRLLAHDARQHPPLNTCTNSRHVERSLRAVPVLRVSLLPRPSERLLRSTCSPSVKVRQRPCLRPWETGNTHEQVPQFATSKSLDSSQEKATQCVQIAPGRILLQSRPAHAFQYETCAARQPSTRTHCKPHHSTATGPSPGLHPVWTSGGMHARTPPQPPRTVSRELSRRASRRAPRRSTEYLCTR